MEQITNVPRLKKRESQSHKGNYGKVLVIAGSFGMSGAASLMGRAALRTGSGLVRVAVPKSILPIIAAIEPCYTTIPLPEDDKGHISSKAVNTILNAVSDNDAVAFGPGIGVSRGAASAIEALIEQKGLKLVIDADGLNNLSKMKNWPDKCKADIIITPHPGEMKRLWDGLFREPQPPTRPELAAKMAQRTKSVVLLKGAGTVVTDGVRVYVNNTGNPGMATAGSGDVLTGVLLSLYGQGFNAFDAAVLGVYAHGLAGDIASAKYGEAGLIATDIIEGLCEALKQLTIE